MNYKVTMPIVQLQIESDTKHRLIQTFFSLLYLFPLRIAPKCRSVYLQLGDCVDALGFWRTTKTAPVKIWGGGGGGGYEKD